jgi:sulfopyruvate decarboxylase alpha subunit
LPGALLGQLEAAEEASCSWRHAGGVGELFDMAETSMTENEGTSAARDWSRDVHDVFQAKKICQVATVPDAGLTRLLSLCSVDETMRVLTLTREDEGIGLITGAWLGGDRAALLMQSSGVGNVVNALSVPSVCKTPCLMVVTMRGQWGEANGWQLPMGAATPTVLKAMGVTCYPVDHAEEVGEAVTAAADMAFEGGAAAAVLISQRIIGAKAFKPGGAGLE